MSQPQQSANSFGAALRRLRIATGLSVSELAERINYSKGYLSKVENGIKSPSLELMRLCDAALGADGELIGLTSSAAGVNSVLPADGSAAKSAPSPEADPRPATPSSPAAESADANASSGAEGVPYPATLESSLGTFRGLLENLRDLGQTLGPSSIVPMLLPQTRALQELSRRIDPASVPEVLLLAARFAEYTSWMTQEMGDDVTALRWLDEAVGLAQLAGDHDLVAYANVRRANIALYQQDSYGTIAFARQAQEMACSARVRSLAAQREAQGHALAGDYEAFRQCIRTAASLLVVPPEGSDDRPTLGAARIPRSIALAEGWGLYDLGRSSEAVEILSPLLDSTPLRSGRARARIGARLAVALASLREIDRACSVIQPILVLFPVLESATVRADLRQLARILNRWNSNSSVRRIMPELSAALTPTAELARLTSDYAPEAGPRA